jgi:dTDP-4-dehydrorhamnose reductase
MKVLVLGCKGQLGRCLNDQLINTDYEVTYTSRDQVDIADFEETRIKITHIFPDVIINASAYSAVDKAENDKVTADLINHLAVDNLAAICFELGCWLIHISTDYVFDGKSMVPYLELDKTNPQGVYGHTKLDGELAIQSSGCKYLIIRTAWVFSEYGNNFLKTMLRLGTVRDELSIVGDQIGCPTYAQDIAKAIITMIIQLNEKILVSGIFHYCGDQLCSWYDFAGVIFEEAKMSGLQAPDLIHSIQTSDYPTAAERPGYSALDCHKIRNTFGVNTSDWKLGVKNVVSNFHLVKF